MAKDTVLEIRNITRSFDQGDAHLEVLKGASLTLAKGEVVALLGPSGSGKSTLLHIAGLLEAPDGGQVILNGKDCIAMSDGQRTRIRRDQFGFVYQFHHLLPEFTALENVTLPPNDCRNRPGECRLAVQRPALGTRPCRQDGTSTPCSSRAESNSASRSRGLLLTVQRSCSPTNPPAISDPKTSGAVFENLMALVNKEGLSAIIATHNMELAKSMSRVVRLDNGVLVEG